MKRISIAIAAVAMLALFVAAAPASAKPKTFYYDGETVAGEDLSFALTGKQVSDIDGYIAATCVPTHGTPIVGAVEFHPPGSFAMGKTRKTSETEYMSYKGDVTKNYEVSVRKLKGRVWVADLHLDYSYEEVTGSSGLELEQHFYICQGDDEFKFLV